MKITKSKLKKIIKEEIQNILQEQQEISQDERLRRDQEAVKDMLRKRYGTGREPPGRQIATERDLNPGGYPVKFVYDSKGNQWEIPFGSSLHKYLHNIYPESFQPATHEGYADLHGPKGRGGSDPVYMPSELELDEPPIDPSTGEPMTPGQGLSDILDTPENRERLVKILRHGTGVEGPLHYAAAQWDPTKKNIRSHDEYMMDILTAGEPRGSR